MSRPRLELLQWFGLLGAPVAWALQLAAGFALAQARCSPGSMHWGVGATGWVLAAAGVAAAVVVLAELAAYRVFTELRRLPEDGPPPPARMRFFAVGSLVANVLFLTGIVLSGAGSAAVSGCRGS